MPILPAFSDTRQVAEVPPALCWLEADEENEDRSQAVQHSAAKPSRVPTSSDHCSWSLMVASCAPVLPPASTLLLSWASPSNCVDESILHARACLRECKSQVHNVRLVRVETSRCKMYVLMLSQVPNTAHGCNTASRIREFFTPSSIRRTWLRHPVACG